MRISIGQLHSLKNGRERFTENRAEHWGYMHEECFRLAVGDQQAIQLNFLQPAAATG